MEKMLARIGYNKEKDMYILYISTDGGKEWGECLGCECRNCKNDTSEEPMYIHISLIEELKKCIRLGYKIVY